MRYMWKSLKDIWNIHKGSINYSVYTNPYTVVLTFVDTYSPNVISEIKGINGALMGDGFARGLLSLDQMG